LFSARHAFTSRTNFEETVMRPWSSRGRGCGNAGVGTAVTHRCVVGISRVRRDVGVEATMVLINDKGQQRERGNTRVIALQPNGVDSKFAVKFSAPADIRGPRSGKSSTAMARRTCGSISRR
jgi:hypothetical protein